MVSTEGESNVVKTQVSTVLSSLENLDYSQGLLCSLRTAAKEQHTPASAETGHSDDRDLILNYSLLKCCLHYHVKPERMTAFARTYPACLKTAALYKQRATNIFPVRTVTLVVNVPGPLAVTVLNPTHPLPPKLITTHWIDGPCPVLPVSCSGWPEPPTPTDGIKFWQPEVLPDVFS